MIGVIANKSTKPVIKEFFELFKTPWQFYREDGQYDVVLSDGSSIPVSGSKLIIIYGSNKTDFDIQNGLVINSAEGKLVMEHAEDQFPVYGPVALIEGQGSPIVMVKGANKVTGMKINSNKAIILRIGYDLFHEISMLISSGQPVEYASFPTIDIHISMLRNWILGSGTPLVEIPPVPAGHSFTVCLTHDVDFAGIRNHKFDHTMFGFLYRAFIGSLINFFQGKIVGKKLWRNWKAAILLPLVYLGIAKDFMQQFDRYIDIEKGRGSTFFIIPYKNRPGMNHGRRYSNRRAAKYDIDTIAPEIKKLLSEGFEVGLHGIDAWHDSVKGLEEMGRVNNVTGKSAIGVRMHWLYYDNDSPELLDNAGFVYDSTVGYNERIGYKAGTGQAFRPPGIRRLLELPLIIMDTALFYPEHMGLTEAEGRERVRELINNAARYGGVLTINWHQRSLGPERLWDDFYIKLLSDLEELKVWFGTADQIVKWYRNRREVSFCMENRLHIKCNNNKDQDVPALLLRIHEPGCTDYKDIIISETEMMVEVSHSLHQSALKI